MIEYRGYVARVEFAETAEAFHGRVINSGRYPIATFETKTASAILSEFHRAVDEYLAVCREEGIEPQKPSSGTLNVRLGSALHARVAMAAEEDGVSINSWIVDALRERCEERTS